MKKITLALIAAAAVSFAVMVVRFGYEYFHPYINGNTKRRMK